MKAGIAGAGWGEGRWSPGSGHRTPPHRLQRPMLLKGKRLLHLCLVGALRLVCLLPGQVSLLDPKAVGRGGAAPGSGGPEGGRAARTPGFPRARALSAVTGSGAEVRVQV